MLGFLSKLTLAPAEVTSADVAPLRALGISPDAIRDAVYVCFLFNVYTRLADTLGWDVPSNEAFETSARRLLTRGYA